MTSDSTPSGSYTRSDQPERLLRGLHNQLYHLNKTVRQLQEVVDTHEDANLLKCPPSPDNDDDGENLNSRLKDMLSELQADFEDILRSVRQKLSEFRAAGLFVPEFWERRFKQQKEWLKLQLKVHNGVMSCYSIRAGQAEMDDVMKNYRNARTAGGESQKGRSL